VKPTKVVGGLVLLAHLSSGGLYGQLQTQLNINATAPRKAISPLIYGTNDPYEHAGSKRLGGNRLTSYNWEHNASNAGSDYFQNSDDWLPWHLGVPDSIYNQPASAIVHHHRSSLQQGAYSLVTLPMAGYVAADKNGGVSIAEAAPSNRWKEVVLRKNAPLSLQPDTSDGFVYIDEELNYLLHKFGKSNTATGIQGYSLDNEPGLWSHTHPLLWGTEGVTVAQLMNRSFNTAALVKDMDSTAEVFGPALYGVTAYQNLQFAPDWESVKGSNNYFVEYYLEQMREKHNQQGRRLLDVLDLHWYPETNFNHGNQRPTNNMHDRNSVAARLEMSRSLWDSTYVEPTWIGNDHAHALLPLIPKVNSMIANKYPGTKLAITEYSYMGINHVSGAIAQADVLGIFGQQDIYMANYWGEVSGYIKSGFDIFRNYNGNGGRFGDNGLMATSDDRANASVYASVMNNNDSIMHVVAINKNQDSTLTATISVNSTFEYKGARVWILDSRSPNIRQAKNVRRIDGNTFTYDLPPMSIAHFELTPEDLFVLPFVDTFYATTSTGYSDGQAVVNMYATVLDGDNNLDSIYVDLSVLGGPQKAMMLRDGDNFSLQFTVPKNTPSGLKDVILYAKDATGNVVQDRVQYRIIKKKSPMVIWDGDNVAGGEPSVFYDIDDSYAGQSSLQAIASGGNKKPNTLHFHFIHDEGKWNAAVWRFDPNPGGARDISEYGYIEFYIKSNAARNADIELSFTDASANMNASATIRLKEDGYLRNFSPHQYSRVRIPVTELGNSIDLSKVWQMNLVVNSAHDAFDVWIDDIAAYPYTNIPVQPNFLSASVNPAAAYADAETLVTLRATVTDPDSNVTSVTADLSQLNRGNSKKLVLNENGEYEATFTIPKIIAGGDVDVRMTVTDKNFNFRDTVLALKVNKPAETEVIWDGDNINTGAAWISNEPLSDYSVSEDGGANQPMAMKVKLKHNESDRWAAVVLDWNQGTNDSRIIDLSNKHYLSLNIKGDNVPSDFDMMLFIRDQFNRESKTIWLKQEGFINNFTNEYQQLRIPLSYLKEDADIDLREVTKIGFLSEHIQGNEATLYIDDIVGGGSMVANVDFAVKAAQCGKNGTIKAHVNDPVAGTLQYYIKGKANPAGIDSALFSNLLPGAYEITIKSDSGFVYRELVNVPGSGPLKVTGLSDSTGNIDITVSGGSGDYSYSWNNGSTSEDLEGVVTGSYKVTVSDHVTGCSVKKTFQAVNPGLSLNLFPNPATSVININYEVTEALNGEVVITVMDKFGVVRSTQTSTATAGTLTVNTTTLSTDTYFLRVQVNGKIYTRLFAVQ
jgi:hypothetical protein